MTLTRMVRFSFLLLMTAPVVAQSGLFREPPADPPYFSGQFAAAYSVLSDGADLVFLYEKQAVKWHKGGSYYARGIKTTTHAIALDTLNGKAWYQTYTVDVRGARKPKARNRKSVTVSKYGHRKSLIYGEVLSAFTRLDSLGFHQLNRQQLTSTQGPVDTNGRAPVLSYTHVNDLWVYLKAYDHWYTVVTYAPALIHAEFPNLYPDRGKWVKAYDAMTSLVE